MTTPHDPIDQDAASSDAVSSISASTLAYLFADRFGLSPEGYVPGQVVVSTELSGGLVAVALWHLRERGAVALEAYSGKKLGFIPDSGVHVRFLSGVPAGGLEKKLLDHLQGSKRARDGRESARDLGNRMAMGGKDPRGAVIAVAVEDAVEAGCLEHVKQDAGLVGRLSGKGTALEPQGGRVAALAPGASELAEAWSRFGQGDEAALAALLRSTAQAGVAARVRNVQYS